MGLELPRREVCFTVFSQRDDARIDRAAWARHAERFFETHLDVGAERESIDVATSEHRIAAIVVLTLQRGGGAGPGRRSCFSRARQDDDLRAAGEAPAVGAGLTDLCARCPRVWLVETRDPAPADDVVALRLAAILAGVLLGPILAPHGASLFGPKTARERLAL